MARLVPDIIPFAASRASGVPEAALLSAWHHRLSKAAALVAGSFRGLAVAPAPGTRILLPLAGHRRFWSGPSPDADLISFLSRAVPENGVFLDVGANIGVFSAALARARRGRLRGAAFEPVPLTHRLLESTLRLNKVTGFRAERIALAEEGGTLRLSSFGGGANNFVVRAEDGGPSVVVPAMSLDEWVEQHPDLLPDAMKIDVEGLELAVLRGGRRTLGARRPALVVECHCACWPGLGILPDEVERLLRSLGYSSLADRRGRSVSLVGVRETIQLLCAA